MIGEEAEFDEIIGGDNRREGQPPSEKLPTSLPKAASVLN